MHKKQDGFSAIDIVFAIFILVVLMTAGFFVYQKSHSRTLSVNEIEKKFACDRITADVRETDVFCGNPKFYNDPRAITKDDYFKYYACDERLKNEPPAESSKTNDPGYYNAYYNCKDETKLEILRKEFIKELEKLKAKND